VLVNNAGYSQSGAVEGVTPAEAHRQFETNVFGPMRLTQLVLPAMREQGWGRIVNVSSMGGELTFPGGGWYHASKHALEALSDASASSSPASGSTSSSSSGADPYRLRRGGRRLDRGRRRPVRPLRRRPSGAATAGAYEGRVRAPARRRAGARSRRLIERAVTAKRPRTRLPGDTVGASLHHAAAPARRPRLGRARRPRLPEAVGAREALREQPDEQRGGQADDVQVVALDPLDERRAAPWIASRRPSPPTRRTRVARELARVELAGKVTCVEACSRPSSPA
jgi:hypothetical protein